VFLVSTPRRLQNYLDNGCWSVALVRYEPTFQYTPPTPWRISTHDQNGIKIHEDARMALYSLEHRDLAPCFLSSVSCFGMSPGSSGRFVADRKFKADKRLQECQFLRSHLYRGSIWKGHPVQGPVLNQLLTNDESNTQQLGETEVRNIATTSGRLCLLVSIFLLWLKLRLDLLGPFAHHRDMPLVTVVVRNSF
jgi:hypothetical protein